MKQFKSWRLAVVFGSIMIVGALSRFELFY